MLTPTIVDTDVVICGGGLAGSTCAIVLARAGVAVTVVDKAEFPRDKPCGEGLLPHGVEQLAALGLDDVLDESGSQSFRGILYHCDGVVAAGDFADDARGRGIRRLYLDQAMRSRAEACGVQFVAGQVERASQDNQGANLHLRGGEVLRARFLVGADGPRSVVRHSLGLDGGLSARPRFALRQHYELADDVEMPERVEVHTMQGFELYLTPVAPRTVGVAALCEKSVLDAGTGNPQHRLEHLMQRCVPLRRRLDRAHSAGQAMSCGPLRVKAREVFTSHAILIGDAAGYVDAITGEGMSLALKTARLGAQTVVDILRGNAPERALRLYRQRRRQAFFDHAVLTHGLVLLARHPRMAKHVIARLAAQPSLFTELLSVNNGTKRLIDVSPLVWLSMVLGSSRPQPGLLADAQGQAAPSALLSAADTGDAHDALDAAATAEATRTHLPPTSNV